MTSLLWQIHLHVVYMIIYEISLLCPAFYDFTFIVYFLWQPSAVSVSLILCLLLGGSFSAETEDTFPGLLNNQVTHR